MNYNYIIHNFFFSEYCSIYLDVLFLLFILIIVAIKSSPPVSGSQPQDIPKKVIIKDSSELPDNYSTTPGGTMFSTTPGGKFMLANSLFCFYKYTYTLSFEKYILNCIYIF